MTDEDLTLTSAVREQGQLISLLQAQVDFQNDQLAKQDLLLKELTSKVIELSAHVDSIKQSSNAADGRDAPKNAAAPLPKPVEEDDIWKEAKKLSLADVVKETAEQTLMTNAGFVLDPSSGLYCNYSTGYYYDPAQCLYYNGHTGTYYTYDADRQEYLFHSQIKIPSSTTTTCAKDSSVSKRDHSTRKNVSSKHKKKCVDSVILTQPQEVPSPLRESSADQEMDFEITSINPKKIRNNVKSGKSKEAVMVGSEVISNNPEDFEEGEVSDSSGNSEDDPSDFCDSNNNTEDETDYEEEVSPNPTDDFPPCIRGIVTQSSSPDIRKGSLFLVTCMGGTIGRDGFHHAILLPDKDVDKTHATILYMKDPNGSSKESDQPQPSVSEKYFISDNGSRSGTFLNGVRLSEPKTPSSSFEILHGSILKIGSFALLLHIHSGSLTCGHCEPGLVMEPEINEPSYVSTGDKEKTRRAVMKQIKRKYGIQQAPHAREILDPSKYTDRASERRVTKGSDNPFEKTQVATVHESIGESNKGFKMLAKMGWKAGKTLGQTGDQGMVEPINLEVKNDRGGLGLSGPPPKSKSKQYKNSNSSKEDRLAITMKRFKEASKEPSEEKPQTKNVRPANTSLL